MAIAGTVTIAVLVMLMPAHVAAQDRGWVADVSIGYAGFVDETTKGYLLLGAGVRRHVTPRVSIGPEVAIMSNSKTSRDRNVMLTGNVVFDVYPTAGVSSRRLTPFVVAGVGQFWGRDQVRGGPYWSSDPAFTAGGGLRARVSDALSAIAEYRIGWEPHQRVSGGAAVHW